jgi:hypothetical protein
VSLYGGPFSCAAWLCSRAAKHHLELRTGILEDGDIYVHIYVCDDHLRMAEGEWKALYVEGADAPLDFEKAD